MAQRQQRQAKMQRSRGAATKHASSGNKEQREEGAIITANEAAAQASGHMQCHMAAAAEHAFA